MVGSPTNWHWRSNTQNTSSDIFFSYFSTRHPKQFSRCVMFLFSEAPKMKLPNMILLFISPHHPEQIVRFVFNFIFLSPSETSLLICFYFHFSLTTQNKSSDKFLFLLFSHHPKQVLRRFHFLFFVAAAWSAYPVRSRAVFLSLSKTLARKAPGASY